MIIENWGKIACVCVCVWGTGGLHMKRLLYGMLRSDTQCGTQWWIQWEPSPPPGRLYILHSAIERHFSSVTFRNIWSEEFLIGYCFFSYFLHIFFSPSFSSTLGVVLPRSLSCLHAHTNTHAWALIWLVQSAQGQGRALMEKFVQLISGGLEMQDSTLSQSDSQPLALTLFVFCSFCFLRLNMHFLD